MTHRIQSTRGASVRVRHRGRRPTLNRVDGLLRRLGFEREDHERAISYAEESRDALIMLPRLAEDETLSPAHLLMIRNTVVGRGVTTAAAYDRLYARTMTPPTPDGARTLRPTRALAALLRDVETRVEARVLAAVTAKLAAETPTIKAP